MKTLFLIVNRIRAYIKSNLFVFSLYCIGTILAILTMILFYASFVAANKYYEDDGYYIYSVDLGESEGEKAIGTEIEKIFFLSREDLIWYGATDIVPSNELFGGESEKPFYILYCYNNIYEDAFTGKIDMESYIEDGTANPVVLPREYTRNDLRVGDSIEICGKVYTIVGFHAQRDPYVIFNSEDSIFEGRKYSIYRFSYTQPLEDEAVEEFKMFIAASFDSATFKLPITPAEQYERDFLSGISLISLIGIVAVLAFVFLYSYICFTAEETKALLCLFAALQGKNNGYNRP